MLAIQRVLNRLWCKRLKITVDKKLVMSNNEICIQLRTYVTPRVQVGVHLFVFLTYAVF